MRFPALILVPVLVLGLTAAHAATSLPDTGQTLCDNGSNVLVACTNTNTGDAATYPRQDGRFGRDAKTTFTLGVPATGFDYTKISNTGTVLPASATLGGADTDWACTRDNITGLTWEVKVNDSTHLRDRYWTYSWYNSDASTNGGNAGTASGGICKNAGRCDTEKFVFDVNSFPKGHGLCGHNDWRMPTRRELLTLVHAGFYDPSIDFNYFPNTNPSSFWSGLSYVPIPTYAWFVTFYDGNNDAGLKATGSYYVRLVSGLPF